MGAATDRLYRFDAISRRAGWGVSDLACPAAAVDFVLENDSPGKVFNDYSIDGHTYTSERLS